MTIDVSRGRQNNFHDICTNCRTHFSCCSATKPPITSMRRKAIEKYIRKEKLPITNAFDKAEYVFPKEKPKGHCIFQDVRTRKCMVHPVKPETCVAGPITFGINKKTKRIEWYIKNEKICSLAAVIYKDKGLLRDHLKSARKEIARLVDNLDARALRTIIKIPEPETFKIGEEAAKEKVLGKLHGRNNRNHS